jgi:hypothetical protein
MNKVALSDTDVRTSCLLWNPSATWQSITPYENSWKTPAADVVVMFLTREKLPWVSLHIKEGKKRRITGADDVWLLMRKVHCCMGGVCNCSWMKPRWKRLWIWCIAAMEPTLQFCTMQLGALSQESCGPFTMCFPRSSLQSIMWLLRSPLSGQGQLLLYIITNTFQC